MSEHQHCHPEPSPARFIHLTAASALRDSADWLRRAADTYPKLKTKLDLIADRCVAGAAVIEHMEKQMSDLADKAIALAKDDAAKTEQLNAALKNQLPPGTVPIRQEGADALNGAVGDDGSIPPTPAAPPVEPPPAA